MPQTAEKPNDTDAPVVGWEGLLVPYAAITASSDGRAVSPSSGARVRGLPVGLKWQQEATYDHDRAKTGLATITHTWEGRGGIWGSGPIDTADPQGAELARKIDEGYIGHVSVDLADWTMTYDDSSGRVVEKLTDFELIAATLVNDAAFGQARVYAVRDPSRIVANKPLLAQRRAEAEAIMAFSSKPTKVLALADSGVRIMLRGNGRVTQTTAPEGLAMAETATMAADQLPAELVGADDNDERGDDRQDHEALAERIADLVVAKMGGAMAVTPVDTTTLGHEPPEATPVDTAKLGREQRAADAEQRIRRHARVAAAAALMGVA